MAPYVQFSILFNIKMSSYQYRKSHCGHKTFVKSSYLHSGISSLYWINTQVFVLHGESFTLPEPCIFINFNVVALSLKRRCHVEEISVTDCTKRCQKDNFQCNQLRKFCQIDNNLKISVYLRIATDLCHPSHPTPPVQIRQGQYLMDGPRIL